MHLNYMLSARWKRQRGRCKEHEKLPGVSVMWEIRICHCCSANPSSPASLRQKHMFWAECNPSFSRFAYFEQCGCFEIKASYCIWFPARETETCFISKIKKKPNCVGLMKRSYVASNSVFLRNCSKGLWLYVTFPSVLMFELLIRGNASSMYVVRSETQRNV